MTQPEFFRVYIALGSNLAQPLQQVNTALEALAHIPRTQLIACSSFYRTKPLGPQNQPDFLNAVVAVDTRLPAEQLLDHTQAIERNQGRVRKDERWGPRTLDLDMLLYGDRVINTDRLTVPHYGLKEREFMLYPLAENRPGSDSARRRSAGRLPEARADERYEAVAFRLTPQTRCVLAAHARTAPWRQIPPSRRLAKLTRKPCRSAMRCTMETPNPLPVCSCPGGR
ncbi:2-amino-4-hydroxy-6-hydroxymethyldihydropteridinepyrophosphokinase [Serratia odorifera]|uniref:2-amino-4-hydroxy-6-hydroxymethyldihydropteridine pyrophosphokinase n=1 Tax=Serratia odorifera TaxID=618 RepID=A0A3S4EAM4_SEROD|nr:2-amino-4-hydroxy-6-hydroxymethyldihydropteridinepyrophosphokinase [Serratia odorifera]